MKGTYQVLVPAMKQTGYTVALACDRFTYTFLLTIFVWKALILRNIKHSVHVKLKFDNVFISKRSKKWGIWSHVAINRKEKLMQKQIFFIRTYILALYELK